VENGTDRHLSLLAACGGGPEFMPQHNPSYVIWIVWLGNRSHWSRSRQITAQRPGGAPSPTAF
jgi:hypothetical protein